MNHSTYIYDNKETKRGVIWDENAFGVTKAKLTHAEVIAAFPATEDGLSLALAYTYAPEGEHYVPSEVATWATQEAQRIFKLGRNKAHKAWLDES